MSVGHGLSDPLWGARKIIELAHPVLVKKAVIEVIDHLEKVGPQGTSPFEIIDRLIQVASEGKYRPAEESPEITTVATLKLNEDGTLSPEDQKTLDEFVGQLNGVPESEEDGLSYEDFLKGLGLTNLDDLRNEDEDEDDGDASEPA